MGRERTGSVRITKDGKVYARVTWVDEITGKRKQIQRIAENRTHAKELKKQILRELDDHGVDILEGDKITFNQLANYYIDNYLQKPEYLEGRKVAGLRSYETARFQFKPAQEYFGNRLVKSIKWSDIAAYRVTRLKTPTKDKKQRSIATVNRELNYLRRALQIAKQEGWIKQNPFTQGDSLISVADEKKRQRILSREEETLLLEGCTGRSSHLKPILVCALDTGMRQGEIFKLVWRDINWATRLINIRAFNTKTLTERQAAMTTRLYNELWVMWLKSKGVLDSKVFGIDNCKKAFGTLRTNCGLQDLRFHDLRHTAATRMIEAGIPLQQVGRILGHTQANTTYRYVNANADTAKQVAQALDNWQEKDKKEEEKRELVN